MKGKIDTSKYIEIPYKNRGRDFDGCDCWGLVRLVYKNEYGIDLLSFAGDYENASEGEKIKDIVKSGKALIANKQVQTPEYGDFVVFNMKGNPCHVGMYIGNRKVLHVLKGTNSVCEKLNSYRLNGKIEGYYEITTEENRGTFI